MPSLDYEKIARLYDSYVKADFDLNFFLEEVKKVSGNVLELLALCYWTFSVYEIYRRWSGAGVSNCFKSQANPISSFC